MICVRDGLCGLTYGFHVRDRVLQVQHSFSYEMWMNRTWIQISYRQKHYTVLCTTVHTFQLRSHLF